MTGVLSNAVGRSECPTALYFSVALVDNLLDYIISAACGTPLHYSYPQSEGHVRGLLP